MERVELLEYEVALVKEPFQFYQKQFEQFMKQLRENAQGPLLTVFSCHDMNGQIYWATFGPQDKVVALLEAIKNETVKNVKRAN